MTGTRFQVYSAHGCTRQHRSYQSLARCAFPNAKTITGEGQYAVIVNCGNLTIKLYTDDRDATDTKTTIDEEGCGGRCRQRHQIVILGIGTLLWTTG